MCIRLSRWYLWSVGLFVAIAKYTPCHKVECGLQKALLRRFLLLCGDNFAHRSHAHRLVINSKLWLSSTIVDALVFFLGLARDVCCRVNFDFLEAFIFVRYFGSLFWRWCVSERRFQLPKFLLKGILLRLLYILCWRLRIEAEGSKCVTRDVFHAWLIIQRRTTVASTCRRGWILDFRLRGCCTS